MDIVGAACGIFVLSPLFVLTAAYIKLVSRGPVIYSSSRVGYGGEEFIMWKFRTMRTGAETTSHRQHLAKLIRRDDGRGNGKNRKPMRKLDDHLEMIPCAIYLRNSCLDELPQLFNVLRGEMTLVGPRPPISYEVDEYLRWHSGRFDAVPGMTGLWQVSGKNALTFNEMVRLDIRYIREYSILLDTYILLSTPLAIIVQIAEYVRRKHRVHR